MPVTNRAEITPTGYFRCARRKFRGRRHSGLHVGRACDLVAAVLLFPMVPAPRVVAAVVIGAIFFNLALARNYEVTIAQAEIDRAGQVFTLSLPADAPRSPVLDSRGVNLPVQVDTDRTATF